MKPCLFGLFRPSLDKSQKIKKERTNGQLLQLRSLRAATKNNLLVSSGRVFNRRLPSRKYATTVVWFESPLQQHVLEICDICKRSIMQCSTASAPFMLHLQISDITYLQPKIISRIIHYFSFISIPSIAHDCQKHVFITFLHLEKDVILKFKFYYTCERNVSFVHTPQEVKSIQLKNVAKTSPVAVAHYSSTADRISTKCGTYSNFFKGFTPNFVGMDINFQVIYREDRQFNDQILLTSIGKSGRPCGQGARVKVPNQGT